MKRIDSEEIYDGKVVSLRRDTFRFEDGEETVREIVAHPGSVAIVPYDDEFVYLVRQPREPAGEESLLEIPAGKRDVDGESALDCAKRELAEEIGMAAEDWREMKPVLTSPGFTDEEVLIFAATGLSKTSGHQQDPGERIEVVRWPLADLGAAIAECVDASSLVGLLMLRAELG